MSVDPLTGMHPLVSAALAQQAPEGDDPGELFEQLFIRTLLAEVQKSMPGGSLLGEGPAAMFGDVVLDELSARIAKSGGLGLGEHMHRQGAFHESGTSAAPVAGAITSQFGLRSDPFGAGHREHAGIDIAAPLGSPIQSVRSGTVIDAGEHGGYGLQVVVEHPDGSRARYAHCSKLRVRAGDQVQAGDVLGDVGQTGRATGPHLHFELMRGGRKVDPASEFGWAQKQGVSLKSNPFDP